MNAACPTMQFGTGWYDLIVGGLGSRRIKSPVGVCCILPGSSLYATLIRFNATPATGIESGSLARAAMSIKKG